MSTSSLELSMQVQQEPRRLAPYGVALLGVVTLCTAFNGLLHGREPFATWFYQFAWFSVLLIMDGIIAAIGAAGRKGEFLLLGRPRHLFSLLSWSAVVWIFYELLNFRLQNWYYVNLPISLSVRWISTIVAFATVLPAVFLSFTIMRALGVAQNTRWKSFDMTGRMHWLRVAGAAMMALVLIWPKYFYPLVWGATTLLVEPWVHRKSPERSLLHDLEQGNPGRILRLLAGGVLIGFLWESLNILARAKWIYTVPGLEDLKLFEMPLLGFFGFPPFALECFVLWQALVVSGVALPRSEQRFPAPLARRLYAPVLAMLFCVAVMWQMDRQTVGSYSPQLAAVVGDGAPALASAGLDVYMLANADASAVARQLGVQEDSAATLVEHARLVTLRGIGTHYAALLQQTGITSVAELSHAEPHRLASAMERVSGEKIYAARVRIWIKGARHAMALEAAKD